jgi:hypothetical protein
MSENKYEQLALEEANKFLQAYVELAEKYGMELAASGALTNDGRVTGRVTHVASRDGRYRFPIAQQRKGEQQEVAEDVVSQ